MIVSNSKITKQMYTYIIKDGQFSEQIKYPSITVSEGMETTIHTIEFGRKRKIDVFVVLIDKPYVFCIGKTENQFPETEADYLKLRNQMKNEAAI